MDYSLFLSLLRAGLWQTELEGKYIPENYDWFNSVIKPGYNQTVLGLVAEASLRCLFATNDSTEKNVALQIISQVEDASKKHNKTLVHVIELLESEEIRPIPLKGQGIASCYATPSLRQCGDIDIFVEEKNYNKAHDILSRHRDLQGKNKDTSKHYAISMNGIEVELHRFTERICNPFVNRKFQTWSKEMLDSDIDNITIDGHAICVPQVNYNVIYVFCHLWNHFEIAGIGLRQLCDFSALIHKNYSRIDNALLEKKLQEYHMLKAWQLIGAVTVTYLGLPHNEYPLFKDMPLEKTEGFMNLILETGNFGQNPRNTFLESAQNKPLVIRKLYPFLFYYRHLKHVFPYTGFSIVWRIAKKFGI